MSIFGSPSHSAVYRLARRRGFHAKKRIGVDQWYLAIDGQQATGFMTKYSLVAYLRTQAVVPADER